MTIPLAARVVLLLAASGACAAAGETIMQIQGTAHRSLLAGQWVSGVHGIVTARTGSGFYVQHISGDGDPATSDALFVFTRTAPSVAVGDAVELSGTIFEYRPACSSATTLDDETCSARSAAFHNLSVTELVSPSILVHASGLPPPAATWIGGPGALPPLQISDGRGGSVEDPAYPFDRARNALDFFETLEGMRVAVAAPLVVGAGDSFGVLPLLADLGVGQGALTSRGGVARTAESANGGRILLDDAFAATPQADVGDTLADVEGVVDYRYGSYRVYATRAARATDGSPPKQTAGPATPGWLSIASFNVENLAATASREKLDGVAAQIATHLGGPGLVALAEMQDDSGAIHDGVTTAAGGFGALVAAIEAAGGPAYRFVQIDPEDGADGGAPGANISGWGSSTTRCACRSAPARRRSATRRARSGSTRAASSTSTRGASTQPTRCGPEAASRSPHSSASAGEGSSRSRCTCARRAETVLSSAASNRRSRRRETRAKHRPASSAASSRRSSLLIPAPPWSCWAT